MSHRSKNLLEAFNASANAEKSAPSKGAPSLWPLARPAPSEGSSKAGGPFATRAPAPVEARSLAPRSSAAKSVELEIAEDDDAETAAERAALAAPPRWQPTAAQRWIAIQTLTVLGAFFLGRWSASGVDASESSSRTDGIQRAQSAGIVPAASPSGPGTSSSEPRFDEDARTAAEIALRDPANEYTIKLCEYKANTDLSLAENTQRYLEELGLPACALRQGTRLLIVVGAAPDKSALAQLLERARTMNGPPPRSRKEEFSDAYIVGIDRVYDRGK